MTSQNAKPRPDQIDILVGKNLKHLRNTKNISQTELASAVGITFQQIQKYEKGINRMSAGRLHQFSEVLNQDISTFFEGGLPRLSNPDAAIPKEPMTKETLEAVRLFESIEDRDMKKALLKVLKTYLKK